MSTAYRSSPTMSRHIAGGREREKAERELFESVKKACNPDETAPKQKHVRVATLFTWDFKTANSFYSSLKMQPIVSDDVQCFKALITVHKVMRDGHPCALQATMREVPFLDSMTRNQYAGARGYQSLINAYTQFIKSKLEFHTFHPEFTANLDYEEYRALRKVDDPNEGYNTISELMTLQQKLDQLQRTVFSSFRASSNNECRIACLVPLVEESYGIFRFITSMLTAMHATVESHAALEPLRDRYVEQYRMLRQFYFECSNLRYLTSLITVPSLPATPPNFTTRNTNSRSLEDLAPRERTPPPEDLWGSITSMTPEPDFTPQMYTQQPTEAESHQQMVMFQQQQHVIHNNQLENEMNILRQQNLQAQQLLAGYEGRVLELQAAVQRYQQQIGQYENQMMSMNSFDADRTRQDHEKDALIQSLQEQVAMWRTKYENIATMYAALRKEHLDLLTKHKEMQKMVESSSRLMQEKERTAAMLKAKSEELMMMTRERDNWKNESINAREAGQGQVAQLQREVQQHQGRILELSQSKGEETQNLIAQFNAEKQQFDARFSQQQQLLDAAKSDFRNSSSELERLRAEYAAKLEEIGILQSGLNQSLAALQQLQQRGSDKEADLLGKMDNLNIEHRSQMDKIMDSVLEDCKGKVRDALFELDSGAHPGNQSASPELVLTMIEKLTSISADFASSFTKHLVGGDQTGSQQAEAIKHSNNLVQVVSSLLHNVKGMAGRLAEDDALNEKIISAVREVGSAGKSFFHDLQSTQMSAVPFTERPSKVQQCHSKLQSTLHPVIQITETLAPKDANMSAMDDLDALVESEMQSASRAIEEATRMIAVLMSEDRSRDPKLTQTDIQVHASILAAAKAITDAIGRLIICATHAQQEIVSNGKGSGSKAAFYKKNSRWMEGLISAAKSVAQATKTLVESADGVVHGTHKMEQLMVAAHEVAGATAQLVAASRVKAIRGSKTQDKLEVAAKAVTDATKMLVKAAEEIRNSTAAGAKGTQDVDFSQLTPHEFKKKEMEQQVLILTLEKNLTDGRKRLAEMRRQGYHKESEAVQPQSDQ